MGVSMGLWKLLKENPKSILTTILLVTVLGFGCFYAFVSPGKYKKLKIIVDDGQPIDISKVDSWNSCVREYTKNKCTFIYEECDAIEKTNQGKWRRIK